MKKKLFAVALAAAMTITSVSTAFAADTTTDLIGKFSFEENLTNEQGGEGTQIGTKFGESSGVAFTYSDAVSGKGLNIGTDGTDGVNLNVAPTDDTYTFAIWAKADGLAFASPILWYGGTDQTSAGEAWTGIWPGLFSDWAQGPAIGGNDADATRPGVTPKASLALADDATKFDWTFITAVFDGTTASLYYNGSLVGISSETALFPSITAEDKSVYIGVNAWDTPMIGIVDECYIYDRALTQDDVAALYEESKGSFTMPATSIDKLALEETTTLGETTSAKPVVDTKDYSATTTTTTESDSNLWIYIVCGVVAVVVIGGVIVIIAKSNKKKDQ